MQLKLALLGGLTAGVLSLGAAAQEWKLVAQDGAQLTFADGARAQRNAVAASIWVLESFAETHHIGEDGAAYRSRSLRYVFNCSAQTYAIAEWAVHQGSLGHGATLRTTRIEVPTFVHTRAGDSAAALSALACVGPALAQDKRAGPTRN